MGDDRAPRAAVLEILQGALRGQSPAQAAGDGAGIPSVFCGKTKVFLANSLLELLEARRAEVLNEKAFCIQCCWRRFKEKKTAKEKRSATLIQAGDLWGGAGITEQGTFPVTLGDHSGTSGQVPSAEIVSTQVSLIASPAVRSWLAKSRFQRLRRAARAIQRGWRRCQAKAAALAAAELDEGEGEELAAPGAALAPGAACALGTAWALQAAVQLWPLGLVLAAAPGSATGPRQALALLGCLRALQQSPRGHLGCGIASIRALPQGPVRFHCRRSPLHFATVSPHREAFSITGLNQILLDRQELLPT